MTGRESLSTPLATWCGAVYVLEEGRSEWRVMGTIVRLAATYRLTTTGLPLVLSVAYLPSKTAFHKLSLTVAIYKTIEHQLRCFGGSLVFDQADNGILYALVKWARRLREFVAPGPAAAGLYRIGGCWSFDVVPYQLPEGEGIVLDFLFDKGNLNDANPAPYRHIFVSGCRPDDTVAAFVAVMAGSIYLVTAEVPAAGGRVCLIGECAFPRRRLRGAGC
mmetsp:Transcript_5968/g.16989  ORF Transcript_5968/g.16989 Transcript_5968/m.16989 type:complete len:219 (+) Transcript_5968:585-1241(+)